MSQELERTENTVRSEKTLFACVQIMSGFFLIAFESEIMIKSDASLINID